MENALLERYSESYNEIATELTRELPAGWSKACVLGEMGDATGQVVGFYLTPDSAKPQWLEFPIDMYQAFRRMHDAAIASGDSAQRWTSATLSLKPDGTFKVDYGYDAIEIDDEDERIAEWVKRYS